MIVAICARTIVIIMVTISLAGCLRGTVNAVSYGEPPQPPMFFVFTSDSLSLTEQNISALIEAKMSGRGYRKAPSLETANIGVLYKYSIDPTGSVFSDPGGAYTTFPRHFRLVVIDLQKSKMPEKIEILWQGEVYSAGTERNISLLAPDFIEALFENYGKTVTNKSFMK